MPLKPYSDFVPHRPIPFPDLTVGPLPKHSLGACLVEATVAGWGGSTKVRNFVTGYWDYLDREGRSWLFLASVNKLLMVKNSAGDLWESPIRPCNEGELWEDGFWVLAKAGFISNNFKEGSGHFGLVQKGSRKAFLFDGATGGYKFHQLSELDFIPVESLYLTVDQARAGLYNDATLCPDCGRAFRAKLDINRCQPHGTCSECVIRTDHTHCKTCSKQIIFKVDPKVDPAMHWQGRTGCKGCGKCFSCSRECVFCPPRDGMTLCRACCKGEHYDEPEKVSSPHIFAYNWKEYPPPRPPMGANSEPTKCKKCAGHGIYRPNPADMYVNCDVCRGLGHVYSTEKQSLYLGVELEVEVPRGLAAAAQKLAVNYKDSIILKADSSIHHGFEIVTGPLSLEEHEKLWPLLSPEAVRSGCRSWNYTNTGLHIHTNKRFYSEDDICKLNVFINEPAVKSQIIKIAGRESYYAALKPKTIEDGKRPLRLPHREALNINPPQTIELRIFKGTLALEHILADLQFMHAAANWVKQVGTAELSSWDSFWYFVGKSGRYAQLITHFNRQVEIERANKEQS